MTDTEKWEQGKLSCSEHGNADDVDTESLRIFIGLDPKATKVCRACQLVARDRLDTLDVIAFLTGSVA